MKIRRDENGYVMWLSSNDTYRWARTPGAAWPASYYEGHRVLVVVDSNGLADLAVDGKDDEDASGNELEAMVGDFLPKDLQHLWPTWGKKGGGEPPGESRIDAAVERLLNDDSASVEQEVNKLLSDEKGDLKKV